MGIIRKTTIAYTFGGARLLGLRANSKKERLIIETKKQRKLQEELLKEQRKRTP